MGGHFVTNLFSCFAFTNNKGALEKRPLTLGHKACFLFLWLLTAIGQNKPVTCKKGNYTLGLVFSSGMRDPLPESILRGGDRAGLNEVASTKIPWQLQRRNLTPEGLWQELLMCFLLKKQRKMVFTVGDEEDFSQQQRETAQSYRASLK